MSTILSNMPDATLKAFETKLGGITSVVFADTPGQAKSATIRAAREAGYNYKFTAVRCRRRRHLDGARFPTGPKPEPCRAYCPDYLIAMH